ncbi:MAG: class I SAM-dependent methyltransferase [Thermoleophilia bacterium]
MAIDWGDGDYARTAEALRPAAARLVAAAGVGEGDRVLDVACGTGNVALAAVAAGGRATGVDASPGLVEIAARRAAEAGADARFMVGDAGELPLPAGGFDAALSCFGVIFHPDPERAVGEMLRAVRRGGVIALTGWIEAGPITAAGRILRDAMPGDGGRRPAWGDREWVGRLLAAAGARGVRIEEAALTFEADSPAAWFEEQVRHHPVWRFARRLLDDDAWDDVRERSVAALAEGNEDDRRFRGTSGYLVIRAEAP